MVSINKGPFSESILLCTLGNITMTENYDMIRLN